MPSFHLHPSTIISLGYPRMSHYASTSCISQVSFVLGISWDIPGFPTMPVLLLHPRSEQYHLSLGHLGTSQDFPLRQYFSYIPGPSSTICPWDILGHPTTPVLLVHPRSEQYHLSLGHPRISHYASTSRISQVRAVPFVLETSWDIPGRPTTPVLLVHPRSEQYYLSLRHLGISQYIPLWQHFSCMYVYILLSGTICPRNMVGYLKTFRTFMYKSYLSGPPWYPKWYNGFHT